MTIPPHGGTLVDRRLSGEQRRAFLTKHQHAGILAVTERILSDVYLIAIGGLSPLNGFVGSNDYRAIVETMHLADGKTVFSIPIVLPVTEEEYRTVSPGHTFALRAPDGTVDAFVTVSEKFERDVAREARNVYGTEEEAHPGVRKLYDQGPFCVSGPISYVNETPSLEFPGNSLTPSETRALFEERGWRTVAAFQTRNPIHRAHEYLTKVALEITDGLLIHPLVGETKTGDIPARARMECYKVLVEKYYNPARVVLSVLPAAMRYAGPREAIHHAIMRKNYGVTHFIVGRDHAGVGSWYGTYDAQRIFDTIDLNAFGLVPLRFEHAFYCRDCEAIVSDKTCPHGAASHLVLSGTKVREMLAVGEELPHEFTRPEVADCLREWARGT